MFSIRKTAVAAGCLMMLAGVAYADSDWLKGSADEKLKTLADLQPGLGTVMIEYSGLYTNAYYAAAGGNWGLAGYHIKEAREIQEVGNDKARACGGLESLRKRLPRSYRQGD